jgi:hypothetical protein
MQSYLIIAYGSKWLLVLPNGRKEVHDTKEAAERSVERAARQEKQEVIQKWSK